VVINTVAHPHSTSKNIIKDFKWKISGAGRVGCDYHIGKGLLLPIILNLVNIIEISFIVEVYRVLVVVDNN
jgi:hypothetical protein